MLKRCSVCKKLKDTNDPTDGFNRNKARKDGYQSHCQKCSSERGRAYYANNREKHKTACAEIKRAVQKANQHRVLEYLTQHPCVDCGEADPVVLEFDHVRGVKRNHVGRMLTLGCSWGSIEKEIRKCEVRCANCHRRRTFKIAGSYRLGL